MIRTYAQCRAALAGDNSVPLEEPFPTVIGRTWDLSLDLLEARQMPEARHLLRLLACFSDVPIPYGLLLDPDILAGSPLFPGVTGARLWHLLKALEGFGLIDLTAGDHNDIPVAWLHPLVRDASAPRRNPDNRDYSTFLVLAVRLIARLPAKVTGQPEDPKMWRSWQLLTTHVMHIFDVIESELHWPDDIAVNAAYTASLAARYQAAQGFYTTAEQIQRGVLRVAEKFLGHEHPHSLATRHEIARMMTQRGDLAAAEAEYRDVLAAELRVLGPDHPSTNATAGNLDSLKWENTPDLLQSEKGT